MPTHQKFAPIKHQALSFLEGMTVPQLPPNNTQQFQLNAIHPIKQEAAPTHQKIAPIKHRHFGSNNSTATIQRHSMIFH
jgi:hypothetical protein